MTAFFIFTAVKTSNLANERNLKNKPKRLSLINYKGIRAWEGDFWEKNALAIDEI
jgi:hypothetical protein